jgi:heme/copper-type cytochrome/quinol oxidase subunit 2
VQNEKWYLSYVTIVTLFLVCVVILALTGVFVWRRNRRLKKLIEYKQTSGREQVGLNATGEEI